MNRDRAKLLKQAIIDGYPPQPEPLDSVLAQRLMMPSVQDYAQDRKRIDPAKVAFMDQYLDPNIASRGMFAPVGTNKQGGAEWAMPQAAISLLDSLSLPGRALKGEQISPNQVTSAAMDYSMPGLLSPKASMGTLGMNVWHGGPNRWKPEPGYPNGRPRLDKMGSGEGAQAYGHGFYSAESPNVAKEYQRNLSYKDKVKNFKSELPDDADFNEVMGLVGTGRFTHEQDTVLRELQKNDWLGYDYPSQAISAAYGKRLAADYDVTPELLNAVQSTGHLKHLDIPDEDVAKFLDWDAPLSEQPESVRKALKDWGNFPDNMKGSEMYEAIASASAKPPFDNTLRSTSHPQSAQAASEALREAGIPGLKYYDGMSRGKSGGKLIDVSQKDGKWHSKIKVADRDGTDIFTTSMPFDSKDAAEAWAKKEIDGGTRNFVTWDQDVLNRTKILGAPKK